MVARCRNRIPGVACVRFGTRMKRNELGQSSKAGRIQLLAEQSHHPVALTYYSYMVADLRSLQRTLRKIAPRTHPQQVQQTCGHRLIGRPAIAWGTCCLLHACATMAKWCFSRLCSSLLSAYQNQQPNSNTCTRNSNMP